MPEQLTTRVAYFRNLVPTLQEAQEIVGGYVQMLTLDDGSQMLMDEDGRMKDLPVNDKASLLAGQVIRGNVLVLQGPALWT